MDFRLHRLCMSSCCRRQQLKYIIYIIFKPLSIQSVFRHTLRASAHSAVHVYWIISPIPPPTHIRLHEDGIQVIFSSELIRTHNELALKSSYQFVPVGLYFKQNPQAYLLKFKIYKILHRKGREGRKVNAAIQAFPRFNLG